MKKEILNTTLLAFLVSLSPACGAKNHSSIQSGVLISSETPEVSGYTLEISGLTAKPGTFSFKELDQRKKITKNATVHCVEGWSESHLWEGISLSDLLYVQDIDSTANTVIFYSSDGYSTSLSLDYILNNNILLAYRKDGKSLNSPYQLVAEGKWGYKWIKMVNKIELSDNKNYKGSYESVGYSIDGDLDKSFWQK
jgi:DMSO/TMAO reductase YedYZ molybdopterin-dependent catalytic subunit